MDPVSVVTHAGGAMLIGDLERAGSSRFLVGRAVQRGDLVRLAHGAVSCPGADPGIVAAVSSRASLACASALLQHGIALLAPPRALHLTANRGAPAPGPPRSRSITWHRGPRDGLLLPLPRATAQALVCLPVADALVAADSVLRSGRATRGEIASERTRWPGPAAWALRNASAAAGSVLESLFRFELIGAAAGTPALRDLVEQAFVPEVGRVDFLVGGWLILETDGMAFHAGPERFALDRRRDAAALASGYQSLRFTWFEVSRTPAAAVARVRRALDFGPPGGRVTTRVGHWRKHDGL